MKGRKTLQFNASYNSLDPAGAPERAEESTLPSVWWSSARFQFNLHLFVSIPPPIAMVAMASLPLPTSC